MTTREKPMPLVCMNCGSELECSPEVMRRVMEGRAFCAKCEGSLGLPKYARLFGEVGEDFELPFDSPEGWTLGMPPEAK